MSEGQSKLGKWHYFLPFLILIMPLTTLIISASLPEMALNFRRIGVFTIFICLVGIGIVVAMGNRIRERLTETSRFDLACMAVILGAAFYPWYTITVAEGGFGMRYLLTHIILWFALGFTGYLRQGSTQLNRIYMWVFPLGMVIYALAIGVMHVLGFFPEGYDWLTNGGMPGFHNIRHIAFPIVPWLAMTICLAAVPDRAGWKYQAVLLIVAGILWGFLIWAGSRGGNLAIGLALLASILVFHRHRFALLRASVIAFSLGAVLSFSYPINHKALGFQSMIRKVSSAANAKQLTSGRSKIVQKTVSLAAERPVFGHGIDGFKKTEMAQKYKMIHAHNTFATYAYSIGFVGVGVLFLWLFTTWGRFAKTAWRTPSGTALGAVTGVSSLMAFGLVDGVFFHYESLLSVSVLLSLGYANMTHVSQNGTGPKT
jgi:O-antigen ligase